MPRPPDKPVEKAPEKAMEKPAEKVSEKAVPPKSDRPLVLHSVIIDGADYTVYAADERDLQEKIAALRAAVSPSA